MKLTNEDKKLLISWGFLEKDFAQIQTAFGKRMTTYECGNVQIPREEALKVLGRERYLSGIARSAFHWSAVRDGEKGQEIYFNSSRLFK